MLGWEVGVGVRKLYGQYYNRIATIFPFPTQKIYDFKSRIRKNTYFLFYFKAHFFYFPIITAKMSFNMVSYRIRISMIYVVKRCRYLYCFYLQISYDTRGRYQSTYEPRSFITIKMVWFFEKRQFHVRICSDDSTYQSQRRHKYGYKFANVLNLS